MAAATTSLLTIAGVYGGTLPSITVGRVYAVNFQATGNNAAGQAFQRVASSFFSVSPATARLTRSNSNLGINVDTDDKFDYLQANVGVVNDGSRSAVTDYSADMVRAQHPLDITGRFPRSLS